MKSNGKPVNAVMLKLLSASSKDAVLYVNGVEVGNIDGSNTLNILKLPKEILKASEWNVKIMRGKSDVTPRFCSVRLIFE